MSKRSQPPLSALAGLLHGGRFDALVQQAGDAARRWPGSAPVWHLLALGHLAAGRAAEAVAPLERATALAPRDIRVCEHLASALMIAGRADEALRAFERCVDLAPAHPTALINAASLANDLGRYDVAERHGQQALDRHPEQPQALFNLGRALRGQGRVAEAVASFVRSASHAPDVAVAQNDIGLQLLALGAIDDAEACLRRAIALAPRAAMAYVNLAGLLEQKGDGEAALALLRQATTLDPRLAAAWINLGAALIARRRFDDAAMASREALALDPGLAEGHANLADALVGLDRPDEAEASYRRALELRPDLGHALNNLGNLLLERKRYVEAERCFRQIRDDQGYAQGQAMHCAAHSCDWSRRGEDEAAVRALLDREDAGLDPFGLLILAGDDAPALQRRAGRLSAAHRLAAQLVRPALVSPTAHPVRDRLQIAYLSADFHDHATMYLLAGVLRSHDRARHAISLYSYGPPADDAYRRLARDCSDRFVDLRELDDARAAALIADDGIDILVDLKGYTRGGRPGIVALRPAPVVVSWLGYPGTLGDERLADYLIGDPVVTPLAAASDFSETLALMPHCYQPSDPQRPIGAKPTRGDAGLPEQAFVFCSFNQAYKIDPEAFAVWCQLLAELPGSVVWLLDAPAQTVQNLHREAHRHGVASERLIFAPRLPPAAHLGRLQLADLALDTYPYGSHTTASDALWAGVPLVTRIGNTFASRVAASLLTTLGLPELVVGSWPGYAALAKQLATDATRLAAVRSRLAAQRLRSPLFDAGRFTADLEALLATIWAQHAAGTVAPVLLSDAPRRVAALPMG